MEQERDRLRTENMKMMSDLSLYSRKMKRLIQKRDYINYKYNEYGDSHRIKEYFDSWAAEYGNARKEAKALNAEYRKKYEDLKTITAVIGEIKNDIADLKKAVSVADYEIDQIIGAFPDLYEQAVACEDTLNKYRSVHKEFVEKDRDLAILGHKFNTVSKEKHELADALSEKKAELAPLLETEASLKDELTALTERFDRQETWREEKRTLTESIGNLEKDLEEKLEKIKNHEKNRSSINTKIEEMKIESHRVRSKIKEYEALDLPYKELRERLKRVEAEISRTDSQYRRLTDEIGNIKIENEILQAKANKYKEIKKMMEDIR
jgi:chromosome segregation ATPase